MNASTALITTDNYDEIKQIEEDERSRETGKWWKERLADSTCWRKEH